MPDYEKFRALLGRINSGVEIYQRGVLQDYLPQIIGQIIDTQSRAALTDVARNALKIKVTKIKEMSLDGLKQKLSKEMTAQFIDQIIRSAHQKRLEVLREREK